MTSLEIAKALSSLPLTVLLFLVLMGGYVEWWIYGSIHRARVSELQGRIDYERARADKWEARFLEVGEKLDLIQHETMRVSKVVSGSPQLTDKLQVKLQALEDQLKALGADIRSNDSRKAG